jgi:hypothetical protein
MQQKDESTCPMILRERKGISHSAHRNSCCRAVAQMATTAGCLIFLSTEIA